MLKLFATHSERKKKMNIRMKTELASLMKTPIERGWFNGFAVSTLLLRC